MRNDVFELVNLLKEKGKTISSMESCTGGMFASEITNVSGSSDVLKFSAVTYSNEYKIKMGVDSEIIDKYSVYSINTAKDMSLKISNFANSNYGIGITGKINELDKENLYGKDNIVFVSIYDRDSDRYYTLSIDTVGGGRKENKEMIVKNIVVFLLSIV
mgnify:CR=1 FL=1